MSSVAVKEQKKRDLISIGIALIIHLLIIGGFLLSNFFFYKDIEEYRGPVLVKLGRFDAPEEETDRHPVTPESSEQNDVSQDSLDTERTEDVKSGEPQDSVKIDEAENENSVDIPVSDNGNGDSGDSETSSEKNSQESSLSSEETPVAETEESVDVTEGREEGNAYETTFDASPGLVGRTFGDAIYQYMPLPQFVEQVVFDSVGDDEYLITLTAEKKLGILLSYYEVFGNEYLLKNQKQPSMEERPQIWSILAEGGYNLKQPDYKDVTPPLKSVVLTFIVDIGNEETSLSNVQVNRSSGNSEIDEAVIFGFQKAIFYNSSEIPVKGRFTYRFD